MSALELVAAALIVGSLIVCVLAVSSRVQPTRAGSPPRRLQAERTNARRSIAPVPSSSRARGPALPDLARGG